MSGSGKLRKHSWEIQQPAGIFKIAPHKAWRYAPKTPDVPAPALMKVCIVSRFLR